MSKSCRLAIRNYIDDRKIVRFEYCPELEHITTNEVKHTESQTDIMDPAILITLPKSQKIALTLKHRKYVYENRVEKNNEEKYTISHAAKFRGDGHSKKFGPFPK